LTPVATPVGRVTRLTLPPLAAAGVYRIRRDGAPATADDARASLFVVQVGRGDSPIAPLDAESLKSRWTPAAVEIVAADAVRGGSAVGSASLAVWAALLAALLLFVETIVVHRLCPKMLPRVAESIVRRPIVSAAPRSETVERSPTPATGAV
jgi:hypothetical protein